MTEPVNNQWIDFILEQLYAQSYERIPAALLVPQAKSAILSKLESIEQEAYKKGYIACGLDELRKYENDKG